MDLEKDKCPNCGTSPFEYYHLGLMAKCHVCGKKWKVGR